MRTKTILIVALIVVVLTVTVGAMMYRPGLQIDSSWLILINSDDVYDVTSGTWLQGAYQCQLASIAEDVTPDPMVNNFGQNLIIVGGSPTLRERAPWFATPPLTIAKPLSQPNVHIEGSYGERRIITPKATYYFPTTVDEFSTNDYGVITVAYDGVLRRWVIIIVGWTAESTACGAKLAINMGNELGNVQWIVYRRTNPITIDNGVYKLPPLSAWSLNHFTYEIVEQGP